MDKIQLSSKTKESLKDHYRQVLLNKVIEDNRVGIEAPDTKLDDKVLDLFEERKKQRRIMLTFLIVLTSIITLVFIAMVAIKIIFEAVAGLEVISDTVLNVVAVSFFVELVLTIRAIVKALWDEKGFLSSPVLGQLASSKN